jgi:hypothetical protein
MLEPHLVKQQGRLKLCHPDIWREQAGHHPYAATATSCQLQMHLGDLRQTKQVSTSVTWYPSLISGINQHNPPRQTETMELKTCTQQRGWGLLKMHWRRWKKQGAKLTQTISKQMAKGPTAGG